MVEEVCVADLDTLQSLVDKSLVRERHDGAGEPRFSMLETIRKYADQKLQATEAAEETRRRHADYMLRLAQQADGFTGARQQEWVERFEAELDNLRSALDWLEAVDVAAAARLAIGAAWFLWMRGYSTESRSRHLQAAKTEPRLATASTTRTTHSSPQQ